MIECKKNIIEPIDHAGNYTILDYFDILKCMRVLFRNKTMPIGQRLNGIDILSSYLAFAHTDLLYDFTVLNSFAPIYKYKDKHGIFSDAEFGMIGYDTLPYPIRLLLSPNVENVGEIKGHIYSIFIFGKDAIALSPDRSKSVGEWAPLKIGIENYDNIVKYRCTASVL